MHEEIEEKRQKLHKNYKMTIIGSSVAVIVSFILIPVKFEALYCGLFILALDVILASFYGSSLAKLKKKETELTEQATNVSGTVGPLYYDLPPSYEDIFYIHVNEEQQPDQPGVHLPRATSGEPAVSNPCSDDTVLEMPPPYEDAVKVAG